MFLVFFVVVVVVVGPADPDYDLHLKRLRVWRAYSYLLCYNDVVRALLSLKWLWKDDKPA